MSRKDKIRRLNTLLYNHPFRLHLKKDYKSNILEQYERHKTTEEFHQDWFKKQVVEIVELYKLSDELGFDNEELEYMWFIKTVERNKAKAVYKLKPQKEGRDNKDVLATGNHDGNWSSIRYPSKKRSLSTWRKFYNLFPRVAELDGWDGKTSKRMN